MADYPICTIEGCGKPSPKGRRGMCHMHYMRWYKHGDPSVVLMEKGKNLRWLNEVAVPFVGDECLPWPFDRSVKGYGRVTVKGRKRAAHRVVCEIAHGPAPQPEFDAAHRCGNGHLGCVNPAHIRWATRLENINEKNDHGTMARGSRNGNAKLDEACVAEIKRMSGMKLKEVAEMFDVSMTTVSDIRRGKIWAWL